MILIRVTVGESCSGALVEMFSNIHVLQYSSNGMFSSLSYVSYGKGHSDELWLTPRAQKIQWVQVDLETPHP